jgi:allophanate hydrolase
LLETLDCVLTPTCPRPVTLAELEAEPVQRPILATTPTL